MASLTVTVDPGVLRKARIRALEQGTSVNALVAEYLASYADLDDARVIVAEFLEIARVAAASSGPMGRTWRRDELYDR